MEQQRRRWWFVPVPAALGAALLGFATLSPSLLPRAGIMQGIVTGLAMAIGYLLGAAAGWLIRRLRGRATPWYGSKRTWAVLAPALALILVVGLLRGKRVADQLRGIMGQPIDGLEWYPVAAAVAAIVLLALVGLGRLLRRGTAALARPVRQWAAPSQVGVGLGGAVLVVVAVASGAVPAALVALVQPLFSGLSEQGADTPAPTSALVSGGPDSAVRWSELGKDGRSFVSGATPVASLTQYSGVPADAPIRVYAGLASAVSAQERAALAVEDLKRFGAFDREVLAVATSTGTGLVDQYAAQPLEYLTNGDSAIVSTQYSYLPSWLSFLVDQDRAQEAARTLFAAVYAEWAELPAEDRPRLLVFGESLGAFGGQAVFADLDDVLTRTDGALFVGPPQASALWTRYTDDRDPGTLEVLPVFDGGAELRWAQEESDLAIPAGEWADRRMIYLQNASDPVVWWSPHLLWSRPDWLAEPRGPDVLPTFDWYPLVTFLQVGGDMLDSQGVPYGHGHVYESNQVWAWAAILQPPGWDAADVQRLAAHLQGG